jgi:hypothetical protein
MGLMRDHGPLWTQLDNSPRHPETTHIVVLYGIVGNGAASNTFVRIMDPFFGPRVQSFAQFVSDFERLGFEANELDLPLLLQLAHF